MPPTTQLDTLRDDIDRVGYKADLGRAQILFGARRYPEARAAFAAIQSQVSGDDRELVDLRIAECDFFLKRYAAARDGVRPYLDNASRKAEARFFALSALRELGQRRRVRRGRPRALVDEFPDSSWSEEALNNLGTHYILTNEDELAADGVPRALREVSRRRRAPSAPPGSTAGSSTRPGDYPETVRVFEAAATAFARSDYRPSFLYWAARAHGKTGQRSRSRRAPAPGPGRLRELGTTAAWRARGWRRGRAPHASDAVPRHSDRPRCGRRRRCRPSG